VLFDPTGDENSEWDGRVFLEEGKHVVNKLFYTTPIFTLIESINDDDERPFGGSAYLQRSSRQRHIRTDSFSVSAFPLPTKGPGQKPNIFRPRLAKAAAAATKQPRTRGFQLLLKFWCFNSLMRGTY
jgi:hypothetical protein